MKHARGFFVLGMFLAACGDSEAKQVSPGPVLRTELDGAAAEFLRQRRATSREQLTSTLERARERLDALRESLSSRTQAERETLRPQLDGIAERITELEARSASLQDLEQMEWERAHDELKRDVRSMEGSLRVLESRLR